MYLVTFHHCCGPMFESLYLPSYTEQKTDWYLWCGDLGKGGLPALTNGLSDGGRLDHAHSLQETSCGSSIVAVLLYSCTGSETWIVNTTSSSKLQTFVNNISSILLYLRTIIQIHRPETTNNQDLWQKRSGQKTIMEQVAEQKCKWLGHTLGNLWTMPPAKSLEGRRK